MATTITNTIKAHPPHHITRGRSAEATHHILLFRSGWAIPLHHQSPEWCAWSSWGTLPPSRHPLPCRNGDKSNMKSDQMGTPPHPVLLLTAQPLLPGDRL